MVALIVAIAFAGASVSSAAEISQTEVPVRSVVLYSSGVGYFEHAGMINGEASTELRFKTHQINDLLKSLILEDRGGRVSGVVYPSQDPLSKTLGSFQVNINGNPSLADLLTQLRGAKLTVTAQAEQTTGTILGVEKKQKAVGDKGRVVESSVVNLLAGGTIRSIWLDDVQKIELEEPQLQDELNKALLALAQARDQDKKPVKINFQGTGTREVRLGYVVETPIWKTSYRLILPSKSGEAAKLQGWAIVENQTDSDWNNVSLSLVSGRPISFFQDLYRPLYVSRPVVEPELYASLRPQTYDAGIDKDQPTQSFGEKKAEIDEVRPSTAAPKVMARRDMRAADLQSRLAAEAVAGNVASPPMDPTAGVASLAAANKLGELFQYTIANVSLPRQRSAMIPIVTDDVEAERVSIYNQSVLAKHPLNGARLKNTSGKHLLQGPMTVLEEHAYAGDARIDSLPPGQQRFLSYGVDLEVLIQAGNQRESSGIQTGRLVKGVLHLTRKRVMSLDYTVENKAQKPKVVIIEHPLHSGWKLVDSPKPMETTEVLHRFRDVVTTGKTSKLTVKEEIVQGETIAILPADIGQLEIYSRSGEIPAEVREALGKTMGFKSAMLDTQRHMQQKQKELTDLTQEQKRIRDNMNTVTQNSQYYTRLLTKLNDQESRIEKLQGDVERLQRTYEQQRKELETYLLNTMVG
jgi:hypothetical protein